jgi:hypothetical protein
MSATPDQLPNDIEEMKRLFLSQVANLEQLTTELAAAKAGLMVTRSRSRSSNSSSPGSGGKNTAARRNASLVRSRSSN